MHFMHVVNNLSWNLDSYNVTGYIGNFVKHVRCHVTRHDGGRGRAVHSSGLEEIILNIVADRSESRTRAIAHKCSGGGRKERRQLAVFRQIPCSAGSQSDLSVLCKNTTYHEGIHQSPCEAMLGIKIKRGISSYFLPSEQISNLETEAQLEEIANTFETEEQLEETDNTSEKI
ncbi:hypothetical protein TNCV_1477131 [Trichonephila clavipes]|nr:hypothetical protein TNCV_1477131 [Trichonephila clavipes]